MRILPDVRRQQWLSCARLKHQRERGDVMRVIICGGRDQHLTRKDRAWLDAFHQRCRLTVVVHGAAAGIDTDAEAWATARGIPTVPMPAHWARHGKAAGPIRNRAMLAVLLERPPFVSSALAVLAFPGGRGTANMVAQARRHDLAIFRVADGVCHEDTR